MTDLKNQSVKKQKSGMSAAGEWWFLLGLMVFISTCFVACNSLFDEDVPAEAREQYDRCVEVQRDAGDGWISADEKCDYLKRQ